MTQISKRRQSASTLSARAFLACVLLASAPNPALALWHGVVFRQSTMSPPEISMRVGLAVPTPDVIQPARPIILAHAIIVRTSPAQGGVTEGGIGKVDVWYDAGIRDAFAALAVVSASGERVDKRDAAIDSADPAHVSVSVNPLTGGKYTVRYRALSADGHLVSGAWEFEVRP